MRRPLDITSLMEGVDEASLETPHDSTRPLLGPIRETRRPNDRNDSRSPPPGPEDVAETIHQAQSIAASDPVNHPIHYVSHPSGIECITITEWMNFNLGNAVKYIWRANDKGATIQDLEKARWYLDREISRLNRIVAQGK